MKTANVIELLKDKSIIIPSILLRNKDNLQISDKEIIFLAYLMSCNEKIIFNIEKISNETYFKIEEIMEVIPSLCEKKLIDMVVEKDKGIIKEYIDIENLYNKLLSFIISEDENKEYEKEDSKIYEVIEKEFGRTLSPIEYELIKQWLDANISEELIKEALKEAVLNGVNNLKYIDRILFEWTKKGYKTKKDVKKKNISNEKVDVFEYNWLDENE